MNIETAYYIIRHFPRLLTPTEIAALKHNISMFKMQKQENSRSIEVYEEGIKWFKEHNLITEDAEALSLLDGGSKQFYINTATRIVKQTPEKVFFNNCSKCGLLARTPYARQCKGCGFKWHDTIAAEFKINKIYSLKLRPNTLYFIGDIKCGTIKQGMKIDLTFLGVAIKPIIKAIELIDGIAEKKTIVALAASIQTKEDRIYLKKYGVLTNPIIIEQ
jgi:hypothetical protein